MNDSPVETTVTKPPEVGNRDPTYGEEPKMEQVARSNPFPSTPMVVGGVMETVDL